MRPAGIRRSRLRTTGTPSNDLPKCLQAITAWPSGSFTSRAWLSVVPPRRSTFPRSVVWNRPAAMSTDRTGACKHGVVIIDAAWYVEGRRTLETDSIEKLAAERGGAGFGWLGLRMT